MVYPPAVISTADISSDNRGASFGSEAVHRLLKSRVDVVEGCRRLRPCDQVGLGRGIRTRRNYGWSIRFRKAGDVGAAGPLAQS